MKKTIMMLVMAAFAEAYCGEAKDSIALAAFGKELIKSILSKDTAWVTSHSFSCVRCIPCESFPGDIKIEYYSPALFAQKAASMFSTPQIKNEIENSKYYSMKHEVNWKKLEYPKSGLMPNDKDKSYELYYVYKGKTKHENRTHIFQVFFTAKGILLFGYGTVP